jgi:site-specific recombinase XerD
MINRNNWKDTKEFLAYMKDVRQVDDKTVLRARTFLRHVLEWADDVPFSKAPEVSPSFPIYLTQLARKITPATMKKTCDYARLFFQYLKKSRPRRMDDVSFLWIDAIKPPRAVGIQSRVTAHEFYSLEDMLKIAAVRVNSLREERDRAAACFLFLSGMRLDAFLSLPMQCVDLVQALVRQEPEFGVRTKNHKAAVTALLDIAELYQVVRNWDNLVRDRLPAGSMWYAMVNRDSDRLVYSGEASEHLQKSFRDGLHVICENAGVTYKSPHKFRHGHTVFAMKRVKNMAELKAVSQNLMHKNVSTTDGIYGNLVQDDVHQLIRSLGAAKGTQGDQAEAMAQLVDALEKLGLSGLLKR